MAFCGGASGFHNDGATTRSNPYLSNQATVVLNHDLRSFVNVNTPEELDALRALFGTL